MNKDKSKPVSKPISKRLNDTEKLPDGTPVKSLRDIDRYYNLACNTTASRLCIGWTIEECLNNRRDKLSSMEVRNPNNLPLPNGEVPKSLSDIDRYYNLTIGTTSRRLYSYWTIEECLNNKRDKPSVMKVRNPNNLTLPNGEVPKSLRAIDRYYNLTGSVTASRLNTGWTIEECLSNKKDKPEIIEIRNPNNLPLPNGEVPKSLSDIDRYYNLRRGTTCHRLNSGRTIEECLSNKIDKPSSMEVKNPNNLPLPNGKIPKSLRDIDRYYNLSYNTTYQRLNIGWTIEECLNNKRNKRKKSKIMEVKNPNNLPLPDGEVPKSLRAIDRYYNLSSCTTARRLDSGWTIEECLNNTRDK